MELLNKTGLVRLGQLIKQHRIYLAELIALCQVGHTSHVLSSYVLSSHNAPFCNTPFSDTSSHHTTSSHHPFSSQPFAYTLSLPHPPFHMTSHPISNPPSPTLTHHLTSPPPNTHNTHTLTHPPSPPTCYHQHVVVLECNQLEDLLAFLGTRGGMLVDTAGLVNEPLSKGQVGDPPGLSLPQSLPLYITPTNNPSHYPTIPGSS